MCQTDESCTFQNCGAQSEHPLLNEGSCVRVQILKIFQTVVLKRTVNSGKQFVPVDLEADSSDSDN